jgi:hypothetical protein
MNEELIMGLNRWSAVLLVNVFITVALELAVLAHDGARTARILFCIFAMVCGGPLHQVI